MLHGTFGEDGTVQGLLDLADVAYVGAGVLGSAVGMDKDVAKRLLRDAGIPVVDFALVTAAAFARDAEAALARGRRPRVPLFVKPANAGLIGGCLPGPRCAGLAPAVRAAPAFDRKVLIERASTRARSNARCSAMTSPLASVPGEVLVHHPTASIRTTPSTSTRTGPSCRIPADSRPRRGPRAGAGRPDLPALELAGMARVDFFLTRPTPALYVNEVNTLPGFTARLMYPKMWEASGLPPRRFLTRLSSWRWSAGRPGGP